MPRPSHPPWFDHVNMFSEECILWSVLFYSFLHYPVISFLSLAPSSQTSLICSLPLTWETKFHTHVNETQRSSILSWFHPPHILINNFPYNHLLFDLQRESFPTLTATRILYTVPISSIRATCSAHHILLYFTVPTSVTCIRHCCVKYNTHNRLSDI
jgi:hypothetical protein